MTITLDLTPEIEARLQVRATAEGRPLKEYVQSLIEQTVPPMDVQEAIKLYAAQSVIQGQAAALAGLSRSRFIEALNEAGVSVFQYDEGDLIREVSGG
jgi:predicted DNA-binding protein (UPF0251 family)